MTNETDYRLGILNSLLTSTHRELEVNEKFHQDVCKQDPLFYVRLGAWYAKTGDIRDHKHLFVANLCQSSFEGHRDIGCSLLRQLAPYELVRALDSIRGKQIKKKGETTSPKPTRSIPRTVRTEITEYLRERENDKEWLDSTILTARKALKQLYALSHTKPSDRAQAILFDNNPPKDSKCFALKEIVKCADATEQAKLINEYKIPYRIASTIIKQINAPVLAVLIDLMTAQELINSMGSLQKHGAFNNPDIKALVDKKLESAKSSKKVASLKGMQAVKSAGLSDDLNEKLKDIVDSQVKNKGRIIRSTALLVDKSGSMTAAIELAKQIATLISAAMDAEFYVYAFDNIAYPIVTSGKEYKDWDRAFNGINAGGGTLPGVAVDSMLRNNQIVEQIILVTDEGETPHNYKCALERYANQTKVRPYTYIVHCGGHCDRITTSLQSHGFEVDRYAFTGDYYSLPSIITYLTKSSRTELLMEIMEFKLPERKRNAVTV